MRDEARLDRWLDDPREERPPRIELDGDPFDHMPRGTCSDCGLERIGADGPCRVAGDDGRCPISLRVVAG